MRAAAQGQPRLCRQCAPHSALRQGVSHRCCSAPHSPPQLGPTWRQTRDFSSRYCSILAPSMAPRLLKWISMYFPKRLELSLRMVLAFPNATGWAGGHGQGPPPPHTHTQPQPPSLAPRARALPSRMGVASSTCCSIHECCPLMAARNCRISFVLSVFPAPDSPLQRRPRQRQDPLQS